MADYLLHHNANTHWAYPTSVETDAALAAARDALADFLGGTPAEVAFGANMTTLTFHLGRALGRRWTPGDEIVVTELDHHANVDPWRQLAQERGFTVRTVRFRPETGQLDMDDLAAALGPKTRLLAIGAASNALGTINDVRRAADLAHAAGALVFVDAVHYAPHALVDVAALGADFLACSAYKFYGPHVGVLWGRQALLEELDLPKLEPAPENAPDRLETGTQNHEGIVGAAAAVDFLASLAEGPDRRARLAAAMAALHERGQRLVEALWTGLRGDRRRHPLRPAAHGAPDPDRRVHGARAGLGGRGEGPRRPRRLRLERRLLRDHGRPPPRPRRGRRRARGLRLLHDPRRGEPPGRGRRGARPMSAPSSREPRSSARSAPADLGTVRRSPSG